MFRVFQHHISMATLAELLADSLTSFLAILLGVPLGSLVALVAFGISALVFKLTRTAVMSELQQDYVAFARSRGLSRRDTRRLALRNALIPIATSLGLVFGFLFGGTILVEVTFALPGIGGLLAGSVTFKDIPVVQAITLITALVIALTALLVDVVYWAVDPRVRARGMR